jgi:hypothetical protein
MVASTGSGAEGALCADFRQFPGPQVESKPGEGARFRFGAVLGRAEEPAAPVSAAPAPPAVRLLRVGAGMRSAGALP